MTAPIVWIESSCICIPICPEVFVLGEVSCDMRGDARLDGVQDANADARAPLHGALAEAIADQLAEAAAGCPVEAIRIQAG